MKKENKKVKKKKENHIQIVTGKIHSDKEKNPNVYKDLAGSEFLGMINVGEQGNIDFKFLRLLLRLHKFNTYLSQVSYVKARERFSLMQSVEKHLKLLDALLQ